MKIACGLVLFWLSMMPVLLHAQQQVTVMSRCGGVDTLTIPTIVDNDHDGMDDALEQKLLDYFVPAVIQFSGESCPGPALDGSGDSNLIVSHIFVLPEQYQLTNNLNSVSTHPTPVVAALSLTPGLVWYNPLVKVNCAVLYGQDCGLLGHTADVEGFNFSIKYTGPDTAAGWMYDTVMQHWAGAVIQTISHEGTPCEQIETKPYQTYIYASPDKHGNYLTTGQCGASFICNPACNGTQSRRKVKNVNIGEPNASLVSDLGNIYAPYIGNDPWSNVNFLDSHGGNAGTLRTKMLLDISSDFVSGTVLTQPQICPLYVNCYGQAGSAYLHYTCSGSTYGFYSQTLTAPGVYTHDTMNYYGCDSIVTLTLVFVNPDTTQQAATICANGSYPFFGQQLNIAGVYSQTITNQFGCDSSIILTLTVNPVDTTPISASICANATYLFNGQQLNAPGMYAQTLTNQYNCDSVVMLSLIINPVDTVPINAAVCSGTSYLFNGLNLDSAGVYTQTLVNQYNCDSVLVLTLTILPTQSDTLQHSICQGESYQGHTTAGTYIDSLHNSAGCDSIVFTMLTVDTLPAVPVILVNSNVLSTDTTGVTSYQWYLDTTAINGAFDNQYIALVNGYYHVVVANAAGCNNTSDSILVNLVGISETDLKGVFVYPNPTHDKLTVALPQRQVCTVELLNALGEETISLLNVSGNVQLDLQQLSKGLYLVKVSNGNHRWIGRVVKE